jgi:hypothetical protein
MYGLKPVPYKTRLYGIFDSGVYRIHDLKWLFPQEKATFDALVMFTSEAKMLSPQAAGL